MAFVKEGGVIGLHTRKKDSPRVICISQGSMYTPGAIFIKPKDYSETYGFFTVGSLKETLE
jgi:hypothetical protein